MGRGAWQVTVYGVVKSRTRLSDFTFTHWRRKWQLTPVFLPGESQGWGRLVGCRLWGRTRLKQLSSSSIDDTLNFECAQVEAVAEYQHLRVWNEFESQLYHVLAVHI